ncbi:DMT family transporter [Jannaschia sp. LMIT008]|uniref:DMT family transporter n=1 Tax=Jannaschia maritima TaxID=3032585 RepID=UPI0028114ECB|nr:DMT family transporter [Jannaschia sp. LMIT008]
MSLLSPAVLVPVAVVFLVGIGFGVQAPLNAALGKGIGSGVAAAAISFGVGFAALLAVTALRGDLGAFARAGSVPWVLWLGGFLGAAVVWAMLWAVPTIGILTAFAALLLGQLGAALVMDAMGAFAAPVHPITPTRVLALVLVAGGLVLSRL